MTRTRRLLTGLLSAALALGTVAARAGATPPVSGPFPSCSVACVSVGDASMLEGDSGSRSMAFSVTLSQSAGAPITVNYRLVGASATGSNKVAAGVDFNDKKGVTGTVTFAAGKVARPIAVAVFGDTAVENDETFRVILSNPTGGARLARPLAIGTIIDDDGAGAGIHVGVGDAATLEGDSLAGRTLAFAVTASNPSTSAFTLNYAVTAVTAQFGATATGGADFGGKQTGTIKFTVGSKGTTPVLKKVSVPLWPDINLENDETLTLTVSAASLPAGMSITRATGTGTIVDDDATPTSEPVPTAMASLGDSMSRAFNACAPQFGECPAAVWSTGTNPNVDSQYSRILAANPALAGHVFNDAVSGATMSNLNGQATNAVAQGVDYVTVEMGGNDACKSSEAAMTSVATYQSQFQLAMTTLENGLPNVRVLVASVPDIERLWFVGKDNPNALTVWSAAGICQSMLASPQSTNQTDIDRRTRVRQRVIDYNTALATVCAQYTNCRYDGSVFDWPFELPDVSSIDYFHPSLTGQTMLAIGTYGAGWNW